MVWPLILLNPLDIRFRYKSVTNRYLSSLFLVNELRFTTSQSVDLRINHLLFVNCFDLWLDLLEYMITVTNNLARWIGYYSVFVTISWGIILLIGTCFDPLVNWETVIIHKLFHESLGSTNMASEHRLIIGTENRLLVTTCSELWVYQLIDYCYHIISASPAVTPRTRGTDGYVNF